VNLAPAACKDRTGPAVVGVAVFTVYGCMVLKVCVISYKVVLLLVNYPINAVIVLRRTGLQQERWA